MAFVLGDRVRETSETLGTGSYVFTGAVAGFRTFFTGIGNANHTTYVSTMGTQWEVGVGFLTAGGSTLDRVQILASTNTGAAINWTAGIKDIRCDVAAFLATQMYRGSIIWGGTSAGSPNAQTITISATTAPLYDYWPGMTIIFIGGVSNTDPMTINVNGLGPKDLRFFDNNPFDFGEIKVGGMAMITYDGTRFRLLSPFEVL